MRKNVTKPCMSDSDLKKHRNKLFVRYGNKTHGDSKQQNTSLRVFSCQLIEDFIICHRFVTLGTSISQAFHII